MSSKILTASGKTIAILYSGGKTPGTTLDVFLPKNLMIDVGGMRVHEETSPRCVKELEDYIALHAQRGATIRYREPSKHGFDVIVPPRNQTAAATPAKNSTRVR